MRAEWVDRELKDHKGEKGEEPSSDCTGWKLQRGKQPGDLEFSMVLV